MKKLDSRQVVSKIAVSSNNIISVILWHMSDGHKECSVLTLRGGQYVCSVLYTESCHPELEELLVLLL